MIPFVIVFKVSPCFSQAGFLDNTFNPMPLGHGTAADSTVNCMAFGTDSSVYIGGFFQHYNEVPRYGLAKLQSNGLLDLSFTPQVTSPREIISLVVRPDGRVIASVAATSGNGQTVWSIVQTMPNGTNDPNFGPFVITGGPANSLVLQPDGKLIIGGEFNAINEIAVSKMARLNNDGSVDSNFNIASGPNGNVYSIALQSDGNLLVGGTFGQWNGQYRNNLVRLQPNGNLDASFIIGDGPNGSIRSIAVIPNGSIFIAGSFTQYDGIVRSKICQLSENGNLALNFNSSSGPNNTVNCVAVRPDGNVLIGGAFTQVNGQQISYLCLLNSIGQPEPAYEIGNKLVSTVKSVGVLIDGSALVCGKLTRYNGTPIFGIVRLDPFGNQSGLFNPAIGANAAVRGIAVQPDGRIVIGGEFVSFNGQAINRITRLMPDGAIDTSFHVGSGVDNFVRTIVLLPDGKILVGGGFTTYNGQPAKKIVRLLPNGILDPTFSTGQGGDRPVRSIVPLPDGKLLVGGWFTEFNNVPCGYMVRLTADGGLDSTFNIGTGADSTIYSIALQPDGKILVAGWFRNFNGFERNRVVRVEANGAVDMSFDPEAGANEAVRTISLLPSGKILLGGQFNEFNGVAVKYLVRLNANGSVDQNFNYQTGVNGAVYTIAQQPDGKILIGGWFKKFGTLNRNRVARIFPNGDLDDTFSATATGASDQVYNMKLLDDGKVLVCGQFAQYDGNWVNRMIRLNGDSEIVNVPTQDSPFLCFPNPSNGELTITVDTAFSKMNVSVFNAVGQLLQRYNFNGLITYRIALPEQSGIYTVVLDNGEGNLESIKVVRE